MIRLEDRVKRFVERLHTKIGVDQVFLFGSTAKGNRLEDSDVDIIVISKRFEGISIPERQGMIQREWDGPEELQALAYTPREFSAISERMTMQEILSYAVDITPIKDANTCPRCGRKGSLQVKKIRNRPYIYYAHHENRKLKWCYIGKKDLKMMKPRRGILIPPHS